LNKEPESMMSLLREQARLYADLEALASRQRSLVTEAATESLLALLAERRKLSSALMELGDALGPARREWPTYRTRLTLPERIEADRLIVDMEDRLKRVMEGDERDARLLSARKQWTAHHLRSSHITSDAIRAYRVPDAAGAYLDRVSECSSVA